MTNLMISLRNWESTSAREQENESPWKVIKSLLMSEWETWHWHPEDNIKPGWAQELGVFAS